MFIHPPRTARLLHCKLALNSTAWMNSALTRDSASLSSFPPSPLCNVDRGVKHISPPSSTQEGKFRIDFFPVSQASLAEITANVTAASVAEWKQTLRPGLEKYCGKDERRLQHISAYTCLLLMDIILCRCPQTFGHLVYKPNEANEQPFCYCLFNSKGISPPLNSGSPSMWLTEMCDGRAFFRMKHVMTRMWLQ